MVKKILTLLVEERVNAIRARSFIRIKGENNIIDLINEMNDIQEGMRARHDRALRKGVILALSWGFCMINGVEGMVEILNGLTGSFMIVYAIT